MAIAEDDLPALAKLFAPMAPELLAAMAPGAPPIAGAPGDIKKTRDWLAVLDDATARALLEHFPSHPAVAAALAQLSPAPPARPAGPWRFVLDDHPAVDRATFWQHLPSLLAAKEKRVLVIWGERQVGKSYTAEFILGELSRRNPQIRVVHQRVDGAGSLGNVINGVLDKLGMATMHIPDLDARSANELGATKAWWIDDLAKTLMERLHTDPKRQIWLALDGHAKNPEHVVLSMFCSELANLVGRRRYDPNGCRLLLIDHPEKLAGTAPGGVTAREQVKLATESDVLSFLDEVRGPDPTNGQTAADIWSRVMNEDELDRMQTLEVALAAVRR